MNEWINNTYKPSQPHRLYTANRIMQNITPRECQFCRQKCSFDERSGLNGQTGLSWQDVFTITIRRKASKNTQHVGLWSRWDTWAEEHVGLHSCQSETQTRGYSGLTLPIWTWCFALCCFMIGWMDNFMNEEMYMFFCTLEDNDWSL